MMSSDVDPRHWAPSEVFWTCLRVEGEPAAALRLLSGTTSMALRL